MSHLTSTERLPWNRFWSPRKTRPHDTSSGFFNEPQSLYGENTHPHAKLLSEFIPEIGLLVLCGEPGLGKTTELEILREELADPLIKTERLIDLKAREFESFSDLQSHLDAHPEWLNWLSNSNHLTILFDGLDEGFIRMPTLVARLRSFLESKPTDRLRLVLSCRSFEWPEAEGEQLATLWKAEAEIGFVFELEPLRSEDARLAAEIKGHDGDKFLRAIHQADVASLASRPITLFFLVAEFEGEEFEATSRYQLYKNGCRRLCNENNPERARLLRRFSPEDCSTDEKVEASGMLACGLLLGGKHIIYFPTSSESQVPESNFYHATDWTNCSPLQESAVEQALGTGLFTALGGESFGFTHQTFAECLAGQILSKLPLPQLRTFLCATDPASGSEFVIPQLVELAAWVANDHSGFFSHLIEIDPSALLRSGMAFATPEQKARVTERLLHLAGKNQFFDDFGYWRFWRDLNHPDLPQQLKDALTDSKQHHMVRRVAIEIAEACKRPEIIPTLFDILRSNDGDRYFRSSLAEAICASIPDTRLSELEPLARGETGPDPDQSILGCALQRLVPQHWSVSDVLPLIGRTLNPNFHSTYRRALKALPLHIKDSDILPGLRELQVWDGSFSSVSFRRDLSMALLSRGLEKIDDPAICSELMALWTMKSRSFHEFFRNGDRDDSDFLTINDETRHKWITAIIDSTTSDPQDRIDSLLWNNYRLIKPDDFGWLLETMSATATDTAHIWAKVVGRLIWDEKIRVVWWDKFINVYHKSPTLRNEMAWFEKTAIDTPARRSEKAKWLWNERRRDKLIKRRESKNNRDSKTEIECALSEIATGKAWAFMNLCWALTLDERGAYGSHLHHDITNYLGWETLSKEQKEFVSNAARRFLLELSDGWEEFGGKTNYSDPGIVAIWMLREEIESDTALRDTVASKWIETIIRREDSSSGHSKLLFALAYRINPPKAVKGWIREIRRDSERFGHPFAIRRADSCFDETLAKEIISLIKILKDPKSIQMAIYELKKLDDVLTGEVVTYLLQREIQRPKPHWKMVESLIIAGHDSRSRHAWMLAFPVLKSRPRLAKRALLSMAKNVDSQDSSICGKLTADEISDFYILLCRIFPPSEDPDEITGNINPRRHLVHFRSNVLETLSSMNTMPACVELHRLIQALPDQAIWLSYRYQKTLSNVRRNEWSPFPIRDLEEILTNVEKRFVRDNSDLISLVQESLGTLQQHLTKSALPAVEDVWQWEGAGLGLTPHLGQF